MEMNGEIKLSELTHAGNNDKMEDFFRYSGSLTAPPCEENVQWTVFEHPIYVTSATVSRPCSILQIHRLREKIELK